MRYLVSFRNVSCRLGGKDVLRGLSLDVEAGETLVLLGRSGSGKTTALKMVNALLQPSAGEVRVEGMPTAAWDAIRLRRRIGRQRAGDADPLALAPGELAGVAGGELRGRQPDLLEQGVDAVADFLGGPAFQAGTRPTFCSTVKCGNRPASWIT